MYKVQPEMAEELKRTHRDVHKEPPLYLKDTDCIITVGDICTIAICKKIREPDISIIDLKTKRNKSLNKNQMKIVNSIDAKTIHVTNKPGTISEEMFCSIKEAIESPEKTKILVEGEEDLATLPAIYLSKIGTKVIYGMPDKGMVVVDVDQPSKEIVKSLLEKMLVKQNGT